MGDWIFLLKVMNVPRKRAFTDEDLPQVRQLVEQLDLLESVEFCTFLFRFIHLYNIFAQQAVSRITPGQIVQTFLAKDVPLELDNRLFEALAKYRMPDPRDRVINGLVALYAENAPSEPVLRHFANKAVSVVEDRERIGFLSHFRFLTAQGIRRCGGRSFSSERHTSRIEVAGATPVTIAFRDEPSLELLISVDTQRCPEALLLAAGP
jgi:hypothetical protein